MSQKLAMCLAATIALMAIQTLATPASAAACSEPGYINRSVVCDIDGKVIGQDPDISVRFMLWREKGSENAGGY